MGGNGEDTKGNGENNFVTGPKYNQRSRTGRTGMVENESQEGHAQDEVLVEADEYG